VSEDLVWKALADNSRRRILDLLRVRPRTTGELADQFEMSRYGVMKHLSVLVEANLVLVRRRGRQRWNHLNAVPLQEAIERWASQYQRAMAGSLLGLRELSESEERKNIMSEQAAGPQAAAPQTIHVELEARINASPARVYDIMTTRIGEWWVDPYRLLDGSELFLELELGGRVYERAGQRFAELSGRLPARA
jgi:DNA-binding transcriptional ArsR family regulator